MSSKQTLLALILGSSFGNPVFARDICTDVYVGMFAKSKRKLATVGTVKLSSPDATDSCALRWTLYEHALRTTSSTDLVFIGSVKLNKYFPILFYHYPYQCGRENEVSQTLGNRRPSGYYTGDNQTMFPRSADPASAINWTSPTNVEG